MPKNPKLNVARYKVDGGELNEYEFQQNQAIIAQQREFDDEAMMPGTPPEATTPAPQGASSEAVEELVSGMERAPATTTKKAAARKSTKKAGKKATKKATKKAGTKATTKAGKKATKKAGKKATKKAAKGRASKKGTKKRGTKKAGKKGTTKRSRKR